MPNGSGSAENGAPGPGACPTLPPAEVVPRSIKLPASAAVSSSSQMPGQNVTVVITHPLPQKSLLEAYLLCLPLGLFGLHHFYLRRNGFGVLYLLTCGVVGIGWIIDLIRMPCLVKEANRKIQHPEEDVPSVSVCDAYITWFPFGIFGIHHYYLRRWSWAVTYTFTLGLFGIGWLVDGFLLPTFVRSTNRRLEVERTNTLPQKVTLCEAYAIGVTPAGIFGAHHFYLGRYDFGLFYLFTLGGCGIGWIIDWFRMKWLVHRANNPAEHPLGSRHKYIDDAYVMAFPFGLLGVHNFYLERYPWGLLYLFTIGLFGIGWLVDLCRMPCLVSEANRRIEEEVRIVAEIRQQLGLHPWTIIHRPAPFVNVSVLPANVDRPTDLQPPSYEASMVSSDQTLPPGYPAGPSTTTYASSNSAFEKEKF